MISASAADARPINCKSNVVPLAITRTNGPWTHTSDDSYIYQLPLVLATATISEFRDQMAISTSLTEQVYTPTFSVRPNLPTHSCCLPSQYRRRREQNDQQKKKKCTVTVRHSEDSIQQ